jgi:hypothetical protein
MVLCCTYLVFSRKHLHDNLSKQMYQPVGKSLCSVCVVFFVFAVHPSMVAYLSSCCWLRTLRACQSMCKSAHQVPHTPVHRSSVDLESSVKRSRSHRKFWGERATWKNLLSSLLVIQNTERTMPWPAFPEREQQAITIPQSATGRRKRKATAKTRKGTPRKK